MKSICACSQAVTNAVKDLNNLLASTEFCKLAYKMLIRQIIAHNAAAHPGLLCDFRA